MRQRALLRKRLDEVDGQAQGLAVIESQSVTEPRNCPHCQGTSLYLHGQVNGLQRYRCQVCRRTFNALTGTALARLRKKDKWLGFGGALGVHRNTALRWRHRFLSSLKADRATTLQGITEADQTYILESRKGCRELNRPPRRRRGKASKAGLSGELVCVLVARDRTGQTLNWVTGAGQMSKAQLSSVLQPVLATDALLVSDGNRTYRYFAQDAGISHDAINVSAGIHVKGAVHIQNVNAYHSRLKQWLHRFHGLATHYLGWFRCMDTHHANSREGILAMALGKFPHLTMT